MEPDDKATLAVTWQTLSERSPRPDSTIKPALGGLSSANLAAIRGLSDPAPPLEIRDTLGEGGMGLVHLAHQHRLGRLVAVKSLKPEFKTDAARLKLLQEAWVAGALEHPNIVPVYDLGVNGQDPYLVLRRIEGDHWGTLMQDADAVRQRFGNEDLLQFNLRVLLQLCNAVHFAHSRNILHRDLKPENVMLGQYGEVYLLDWGIALSLGEDETGRLPLASEARIAGTPAYMAPEMVRREAIGIYTDVYLLGGLLCEILTGAPPHDGSSVATIFERIAAGEVPDLPEEPEELVALCRQALSPDPAARPASAEEVRNRVEGWLAHRSSQVLSTEALQGLSAVRDELARGSEADRVTLYNAFGACRFGFRTALKEWPDNAEAKKGLFDAVATLIRYELAHGTANNALALLADLDPPDPELTGEVQAKQDAERAEREALRALERDRDPRIGARTRAFVGAVLCTVWMLIPLFSYWVDLQFQRRYPTELFISTSVLLFLFTTSIGFWARQSLSKTSLNRQTITLAAGIPLLQGVLGVGALLIEMPLGALMSQLFFLWFVASVVATWAIDLRFAPTTLLYGVGYLIVAALPEWAVPAMGIANGLMLVFIAALWGPEAIRQLMWNRHS